MKSLSLTFLKQLRSLKPELAILERHLSSYDQSTVQEEEKEPKSESDLPSETPTNDEPSDPSANLSPQPEAPKPSINVPLAQMPDIEGESECERLIRSHNSSLYDLRDQVIVGKIVAVRQNDVLVDLGWKDYQIFFKSELVLSQIYRDDPKGSAQSRDVFRPGDKLRFRIEELATPHGDIFVSTQKMRSDVRGKLVWDEIKLAYREEIPIMGRVLNACNGGYAIGIAGFVAFCPLHRISMTVARRIGVLQPFIVENASPEIGQNLVVRDATVMVATRSQGWRI